MKIIKVLPKINLNNLSLIYLEKIKKDLTNNIISSKKTEERRTYNEIYNFINHIENVKIKKENQEKIDWP